MISPRSSSISTAVSRTVVARLKTKAFENYELPAPAGSKRIPAMEGLRGLAVLLVFGVHYHALLGASQNANSPTFRISSAWECIGHSGVDLFFLMSGFLIFGALAGKNTSVVKFMRRRIQRIYPTFLVVLALYLILSAVFPSENKIPAGWWDAQRYVLANVLLLPGMLDIQPIITVAWSLSYEIFFYLFLPAFVWLFSIRKWEPKIRVIFFSLLSAGYLTACIAGVLNKPRLVMFFAGIILYDLQLLRPSREPHSRFIDGIGFVGLILMFGITLWIEAEPGILRALPNFHELSWSYRELVLFVGFLLFTWSALNSRGLLRSALSWAPLRWLGNMSYSYYLIHGLTLKGAGLIAARLGLVRPDSQLYFWIALPVCLAATFATSTILYMLVERRYSILKSASAAKMEKLHITTAPELSVTVSQF